MHPAGTSNSKTRSLNVEARSFYKRGNFKTSSVSAEVALTLDVLKLPQEKTMARIFVFILLIAASSLVALSPLDLKNGGFEQEAKDWRISNAACTVAADAAHSGTYGLRIQDYNPTVESEVRSQNMQVTPGRKYAVRFWTRSKVERTNTMLCVFYFSEKSDILNAGKQKKRYFHRIKGTRQWTENIYITTAPKNAKYACVCIKTGTGNLGRLDIDDIEVQELTKNEAKNMKTTTQDKSQNLRFPEIEQERILELEKILPEKPMGVGEQCSKRDIWDKLAGTRQGIKAIDSAAKLLKETFPELADELYLEFSQNGNRTNYEAVNNKRVSWIVQLALAECLENKGRFMPKLEEFLEQFLSQKSWVLPAHDGKLTNFNNEELYPDLSCSSVAAILAYVDWFLQDKLRRETRQRIRNEVFRRAITPYQNAIRTGKIITGLWWMTSIYNWNAVCTCNLVCASLILMESRHDRAEVLAAMEVSNKFFYRGFTSDGYCSEGLGYWSYGFGHYLTMAEIVLASTNGKLNIFNDDPVIPKCCEFARSIMIEDGIAPAYADCGMKAEPGQFNLAIIQRHYPELLMKPVDTRTLFPKSLVQFAIIAFAEDRHVASAARYKIPPVSFFDKAGVLICRSTDESGNTFGASIKGGHNNEAHNHNDVGSYVIVANKVPFICDPGGEVYTRRTFSPERYESKVLNSYGHDVPVVAGRLQLKGASAKGIIKESTFTSGKSSILIDMTSCYDVAELVSLTRRFTFDHAARRVIVTDNVVFNSPQTFDDAIVTCSSYRINSNSNVDFHDNTSIVAASIALTGAEWRLEEEYIENPKRISPTRLCIKLSKPVQKATVECTYDFKPVSE